VRIGVSGTMAAALTVDSPSGDFARPSRYPCSSSCRVMGSDLESGLSGAIPFNREAS
jgi:hypothetical protein